MHCTDYDLTQHAEHSGENFEYIDQETNERYIPYVIEPSLGADRLALAFLANAYQEEELEDGTTRTVMNFHPAIAPYRAAVFPLSKKLSEEAQEVFRDLAADFMVDYDESGSIGKRYRRHDEVGTPYCITYDFDSKEDGQVTVRDRDTMEQTRMPISELKSFLADKMKY